MCVCVCVCVCACVCVCVCVLVCCVGTFLFAHGLAGMLPTSIAMAPDATAYVAGTFTARTLTLGSSTVTNVALSGASTDFVVARVEPARGGVTWAWSGGGAYDDTARGVALLSGVAGAAQRLVLTGDFASNVATFDSILVYNSVYDAPPSAATTDIFVGELVTGLSSGAAPRFAATTAVVATALLAALLVL